MIFYVIAIAICKGIRIFFLPCSNVQFCEAIRLFTLVLFFPDCQTFCTKVTGLPKFMEIQNDGFVNSVCDNKGLVKFYFYIHESVFLGRIGEFGGKNPDKDCFLRLAKYAIPPFF